jgi:hypothetical protein
MPPSAWPKKRRDLYVEAVRINDPTAPKPVHPPGECEECDIMRQLRGEIGVHDTSDGGGTVRVPEPVAAADAQLRPDGYSLPELKPWVAGPSLLDRIGDVKAYPGTVALLLGMMAGIGLCTIFGPGWAVAVALVLGMLLIYAAT